MEGLLQQSLPSILGIKRESPIMGHKKAQFKPEQYY